MNGVTDMNSLWVKKDELSKSEWHGAEPTGLTDGQVLLQVEKYALTANNITYAAVGDGFGYWNFFPTGDAEWGIVPVWGFATVVASENADVQVGERVYGYLPMGSHLVVNPGSISDTGFVDMAEHRQGLAIIYNQYHRLGTEQGELEAERAIFQPLFTTSFLIEDFMRSADWFGAKALVLTSASSKTGLGLAQVAKNLSPSVKRIGLTSAGNVDFVTKTGLYDQVLTYDQLDQADAGQSTVSVDFAGNGKLLANIHAHWGDNLKFSSLVGATHVEERGNADDLVGPKPELFFAPTAAESLMGKIGPTEFRARVDAEFAIFVKNASDYLHVENLEGPEALQSAYLQMLANEVTPSRGLMCHF
ncbi:MAG: DUF2855 family protein [Parasphingorhabdus sp.]